MSATEEDLDWARGVMARKAMVWVLAPGPGIVGEVQGVYAPGEHEDDNGNKLDKAVIKVEPGHTFIFDRENLVELTDKERNVAQMFGSTLNKVLAGTMAFAKLQGIEDQDKVIRMLRAILRSQQAALA
jgi:hypothetical protein